MSSEINLYYLFGKFALVGILVLFSAMFSSFETAFFSLSEFSKEKIASNQRLIKMLNQPKEVLANILIGNILVNTFASIFATSLLIDICDATRIKVGFGVAAAIVLMTIIMILYGEIIPKTFALKNSELSIRLIKPYFYAFSILVTPLKVMLLFIINLFTGKKEIKEEFTEEEVRSMLEISKKEGIIKEEEERMIHKIFEFSKTNVKEVMIPIDKVASVSINDKLRDVLRIIKKTGFSRLPVYKNNNSNIIGIIYAKDLLEYFGRDKDINLKDINLKEFIKKVFFVSESKKINKLFYELQSSKVHLAMVTDKKGKAIGLATIEDLMEEIVGEIKDEFDQV
ncbi:DUF21 domain-containing protein [bacterium]|nr:DUF21 domain-containing protein [bacterium]